MTVPKSTYAAHEARVQQVASAVQSFHKRREPFRIYHGGTNSTRRRKYDPSKVIDTSGFSNVLSIDKAKQVAIVEPNVSMEQLVDATIPFGLVPLVVMEFPAITVGGGFSGSSGESSSFRHGLFENTINRIEIVLGDGTIVEASRTENADLYHGASGCFGTLGVVTKLEVQLMDAKPYVDLSYWSVSDTSDAIASIKSFTSDGSIQYLDGIMFSKSDGIIMAGLMVDADATNSGVQRQQYRRPWDPWFFIRAKEIHKGLQNGYRELIPLKDYLFRYDRGAFWAGYYCFEYFITPFNRLTRWALDELLHTRTMYAALHKSGLASEYIVQDIGFPYETAPDFVEYLDQAFQHYPLWLCPLLLTDHVSLSPVLSPYTRSDEQERRVLNIGVWGPGPKDRARFVDANRRIEKKTKDLGGLKCLYAHAYYTEGEFWSIYNKPTYDELRAKYNAQLIPSVFDKVTINDIQPEDTEPNALWEYIKGVWPMRGVYGAFHVLLNRRELGLTSSPVHIVLFIPFLSALIMYMIFTKMLSYLFGPFSRGKHMEGKKKKS